MKQLLTIASLLVVLAGCNARESKDGPVVPPKTDAAAPGIRIGLTLPLTGSMASLGETVRNAAQMAVEDEQAAGTIVTLVAADDAMDPARSVAAATRLAEVDKVDALISFSSSTSHAVAPVASTYRLPHLAIASDGTVGKNSHTFVNWTPPQEEAALLAQELKRRNLTSAALLGLKHQGVDAVFGALEPELKKAGIALASKETFSGGERDFRVRLSKILATKPAVIVLEAFPPEADLVLKQLKELAPNQPVTSIEAFEFVADKRLVEGGWEVTGAMGDQAFVSRYVSRFGKHPVCCAAFVYDSIRLLAKGKREQADIVAWLSGLTSYQGVAGPMTKGADHVFHSRASVAVMRNGAWIEVRTNNTEPGGGK